MIEEDDVVLVGFQDIESFFARWTCIRLDAEEFHEVSGNLKVHVIVIYDEYTCLRRVEVFLNCLAAQYELLSSLFVISDGFWVNDLKNDRETEGRAHAVTAADIEFAVHHCKELVYDGQAETGSFYVAVALLFDPLKGHEEFVHVLVLYADTCIDDVKTEANIVSVDLSVSDP